MRVPAAPNSAAPSVLGSEGEPFRPDALSENRAGRLTDAQRTVMRGIDQNWSGTVRVLALVLALAGVALVVGTGTSSVPTILRAPLGVACFAGAAVLAYVSLLGGSQLARDLREGRVEQVQGAIRRDRGVSTSTGNQPRRRYLEVGGKRLTCGHAMFDAAPPAGIVRVYYLPRSSWAVNLEPLPDRPLPAGALDDARAAMGALGAALASGDRTARADALATVVAIEHAATTQATAPATGPVDARSLSEAIIGTWRSPLVSARFEANGTAEATLLTGATLAGRWSIGADGRLRLDGLGEASETEAHVAGDTLSLTLDGQLLTFRRAG